MFCAALALPSTALAQREAAQAQTREAAAGKVQATPLAADALYRGWRVSRILGKPVTSRSGQELGMVRNLVLADDGSVEALVVEGIGTTRLPEFVFRIPWQRIVASDLPRRITADIASGDIPEYGMFPGTPGAATMPSAFRVSAVIGDFARLQAGQGYGYVSDMVFTPDGKLLAILVTRDATGGGGTYAFGYPGTTGRWDPHFSYYGLPYVTAEQATRAAVRVDHARFEQGAG
jgi:sporulation protein YlmC with PRC-barrel domain